MDYFVGGNAVEAQMKGHSPPLGPNTEHGQGFSI
jgi:hypothetical protein